MSKILQTPNPSPQKIPFWRRRWFWGAVMGVVTIIITIGITHFYLLISIKDYFIFLPAGFIFFFSIISFGFLHFLFLSVAYSFPSLKFIIISSGYYSIVIWLFYKNFKDKSVKIRYPIIYFFLLGISTIGCYMLIKAMSNF